MRAAEAATLRAAITLGRALREAGVRSSVDEEVVFCRALGEIDVRRRTRVYWAARSCFIGAPDDVPAFDAVFDRFWAGVSLDRRPVVAEHTESDPRMAGSQQGGESVPQYRHEGRSSRLLGGQPARASQEIPTAPGNRVGDGRRRGVLAAWSPDDARPEVEPLGYRDEELEVVRRLAGALRAAAPERRSRRQRPARSAGRLDVARTLRRAMRTDGEVIAPAWTRSTTRPRRVLLLCDVSGSMERYSRSLLATLKASVEAGIRAEAFVFATRLTRLTGDLAGHDVAAALERARGSVEDWSGGTRIGPALREFNRTFGRRGASRGAIVVLASDGWDRGDPDLLATELARLRLQSRRLIWLNPRPNAIAGQPLAIGMRAALPFIDDYVNGADARAAGGLATVIASAGSQRPSRRQRPFPRQSATLG